MWKMKGTRNIIYISLALGMLLYAVPRLELGTGLHAGSLFGVFWVCFALLVIGAHLHQILGVDEETKQEMKRIKKFKQLRMQQAIERRVGSLMKSKS
jgi:hypothetical protein